MSISEICSNGVNETSFSWF